MMQKQYQSTASLRGARAGLAALVSLVGCASPGTPRPPSLKLPASVHGLVAERNGDAVTLRFTMPLRTTDGQAIRETALTPVLCRAEAGGACVPGVAGPALTVQGPNGTANNVSLRDVLPASAASGSLRLVEYRVELQNSRGRTAGFSQPTWIAAGAAPAPIAGFTVSATRLGSLLAWKQATGEQGRVLVSRTRLAKDAKGEQETTMLRADTIGNPIAGAQVGTQMMDTTALEGVAYRYVAFRERTASLGGHTLMLRSVESAPVDFTLLDTFAPPTPTDLSAAPFTSEATAKQPPAFAVDLIWRPVDDPGLAGYNVYRATAGNGTERSKLNKMPLTATAFHDATAMAGTGYAYSVTAIDHKGNESAAVTVTVKP